MKSTRRSLASFAAVLGALASVTVVACAVTPEDEREIAAATTHEDSTLTRCPDGQTRQCFPGEGPGGTTLCGCIDFPISMESTVPFDAGTSGMCNRTVVPVPHALAGLNCTTGILVGDFQEPIWACPTSAPVPHRIDYFVASMPACDGDAGSPIPLATGCEVVETFTTSVNDPCLGNAASNYQFVVANRLVPGATGRNIISMLCGGPCAATLIPH